MKKRKRLPRPLRPNEGRHFSIRITWANLARLEAGEARLGLSKGEVIRRLIVEAGLADAPRERGWRPLPSVPCVRRITVRISTGDLARLWAGAARLKLRTPSAVIRWLIRNARKGPRARR